MILGLSHHPFSCPLGILPKTRYTGLRLMITSCFYLKYPFSSIQFSCSVMLDYLLPHEAPCSTPGLAVHHQLLEFAQTHVPRVGDAIQPSHPLSPPSPLPPTPPSIRVFSSESALHIREPKYWTFSISPSNQYSGLISFRIDWFDLLAVQGTLQNLLQHNSKASILQCSTLTSPIQRDR